MYPASQSSYFQPTSWQNQASSFFNNPVYNTQDMGQGVSSLGGAFNFGGLANGLLGGVAGIFSGLDNGSGQLENYLNQGIGALNNTYNQGLGYLQPYQQAGTQAMGQYQNYLQQLSNPGQMYNNIMSQYQMTPAAQFQLQQGTQAANRSAAAGGNVGTPAAQKDLMQYAQGLSSQDMQQYFQNQMGINQMYGQGLQGLMGQGYGAANAMDMNRMGLGNQLADMYSNMGMAGMYGQQAQNSGIFGGVGSILSGFGL